MVMAESCKAGVGFSSSCTHLLHQPFHPAEDPRLHPQAQPCSASPRPRGGCWAPPGALAPTSVSLSNAWTTSERNTYPREEMPRHVVPHCGGHGCGGWAWLRWARHEASGTLSKGPQAPPLCSSIPPPPPSLLRGRPAPLQASPPPFCAILVLISRFSDSLTNPFNKVARQSHRHSAPTLRALSRTWLFK